MHIADIRYFLMICHFSSVCLLSPLIKHLHLVSGAQIDASAMSANTSLCSVHLYNNYRYFIIMFSSTLKGLQVLHMFSTLLQ